MQIAQPLPATLVNIGELNSLAAAGLVPMFHTRKGLFCYRLMRTNAGLVSDGLSHRYTLITLLGLARYEQEGGRSPVPVRATLEAMLAHTDWLDNVGDLGLLLWTCAVVAPEHMSQLFEKLRPWEALERFPDGRERRTMELAWLLTGLAYGAQVDPECAARGEVAARQLYWILNLSQGAGGAFPHLSRRRNLGAALRARIGTFADQVYPIYAFTQYALAYGDRGEPLQRAMACADNICRRQGPLGQWWWHYGADSGRVVRPYPVYSVHQDGMAPMALFAIGEAAGRDYTPQILKGLDWIAGQNELDLDLRESGSQVIWRSFYRRRWQNYASELAGLLGAEHVGKPSSDLLVLHECRPYHLGWLLYAFAARRLLYSGAQRTGSVLANRNTEA